MAAAPELYPDLPALDATMLDVGDGHRLHVETWGSPSGVPALVLHGGPGSGFSPLLRRFFDPQRYRIVCIDQRGAGRSTPSGGLHRNDTAALLADLRQVRRHLGIDRWLVVGGSWGATLALAHALDEPRAVQALLLRGTFLARPQDIDAFFADAPAALRVSWPQLHELPPAERDALLLDWWRHERRRAGAADVGTGPAPPLAALQARYGIQSHYLRHGCWLQNPPLLDRCTSLPRVPTVLLHGRFDGICPPDGAVALQAKLPHAALRWADGAGHDPTHPAMVALMRGAADTFAAHARFDACAAGAA